MLLSRYGRGSGSDLAPRKVYAPGGARPLSLPVQYRLRLKKCVIRRSEKRRQTYRTVRQDGFYSHPRDFDSKLIVKFDGGKCGDAHGTVQEAVATWRLVVNDFRGRQVATAPCTVPFSELPSPPGRYRSLYRTVLGIRQRYHTQLQPDLIIFGRR